MLRNPRFVASEQNHIPPLAVLLRPNVGHGLPDHTQHCTIVSRTHLDQWSARCKDLYLTTHNTHNWWTSMPLGGLKPIISAGELLYTYAVDRMFTWTGTNTHNVQKYINNLHIYFKKNQSVQVSWLQYRHFVSKAMQLQAWTGLWAPGHWGFQNF
jgi:hypothetical protein